MKENWKAILAEMGVGQKFLDMDFHRLETVSSRLDGIRTYMRDFNSNLILFGRPGSGKTTVAIYMLARRVAIWGRGPRYFNAEKLYAEWVVKSREGAAGHFGNVLSDASFLVVDDLGRGDVTDAYQKWIYSLINARWENERPTLVTTNLTSGQMVDILGDAVVSRLFSGETWRFQAKDYRIEGRGRTLDV